MKRLREACQVLERASRNLLESLESGEGEALDRAMCAREEAIADLRSAVRIESPGPSERDMLARVCEIDARLRHCAQEAQRRIQAEQNELATRARAVRALRGERGEPRFIARHV